MAKKLEPGWFPTWTGSNTKVNRHYYLRNEAWSLCKNYWFDTRTPKMKEENPAKKCKKCDKELRASLAVFGEGAVVMSD